ncbi:MAG TPA: ribose ABC transporter permease [Candidatus Methylomirabilis sp.]|nr:ribose ABC transporter permease [Candidatus Methylomirabilis sp.]
MPNTPSPMSAGGSTAVDDAPRSMARAFSAGGLGRLLIRWSNIWALALLFGISAAISPYFLSVTNIFNVIRGASMVGIVSIGMTFVILNRGIDLSVGSILGLSAALAAGMASHGSAFVLILALLVGSLLGLINGLIITRLQLQPFIATLGMLIFARGVVYIYTSGSIIVVQNPPESFTYLGSGRIGPVPVPIILFVLVWAIAAYVLSRTVYGREVYAVGANEEGARLSGINVMRNKVLVYGISGFLASLAGVVLLSRLTAAEPNAGTLFELDAIAATLIGGTAFEGGIGGVHGTIAGVLILAFLGNILNLTNVSPYTQMLLKGVIIVLAVVVSELKNRR